jgi:cell division protein FtsW
MIGMQAVINICVVTGLLPTKGIPLPFVSFGGSSLLVNMMSIGILMNIAAQERG